MIPALSRFNNCRFIALAVMACVILSGNVYADEMLTLNQKDSGYRGIWYFNQKSGDEYVYKYSGGLGTYCAKHQPFACYSAEADKTFFCYGGSTTKNSQRLLHMVSYFDHRTGQVPRPTILLDKQTNDAHDNPVLTLDDEGYIWIFSTSHGRSRPSFVHRSEQPYSVDRFVRINASFASPSGPKPLDNFSYFQAWYRPKKGFTCFFTRYGDPAKRTNMYMTSRDGVNWSEWQRLAAIEWGHYQISAVDSEKAAAAFNFHPEGKGLNWRTNLYYLQTTDNGKSWQNVNGESVSVPLTSAKNKALVKDFHSQKLNVYLKDICFDRQGRPLILFVTSKGYESGPENAPRTWTFAHWREDHWHLDEITTSDNNYDMGSLYVEDDQTWRLIAPVTEGPQPFNPGGEMAMWLTRDQGNTWQLTRQLTAASPHNHTYARKPVNAHPDFYAFWADGHGRQPSASRLYFCNQGGDVFQLPDKMDGEFSKPIPVLPPRALPAR